MLGALNNFCRRLWRDESGVVLALTVVVFLTLFVIACTVYAVGEHIRQRIELQNAADAAAYSGAVVQADALSRIAAINKAMAWTYVQMGRAVMDYDVDVWLEHTLYIWKLDWWDRLKQLTEYPTLNCLSFELLNSWIGQGPCGGFMSCFSNGQIRINGGITPSYFELNDLHNAIKLDKHWGILGSLIGSYRQMIVKMNLEERKIRDDLTNNIYLTVTNVLTADLGYPHRDDLWYYWTATDAKVYCKTNSDETTFLSFLAPPNNLWDAFEEGIDVWFRKKPGVGEGIQRIYSQQPQSLLAEWGWSLQFWSPDAYGVCTSNYVDSQPYARRVTGEDARKGHPDDCYETEKCEPLILNDEYFKPYQHVVVAVARKVRNPLEFMFEPGLPGLFRFFQPTSSGDKAPYSWAVASARAGYRKDGGDEGAYWTEDKDQSWRKGRGNLSQWDWDAVLIPVQNETLDKLWGSGTDWHQLFDSGVKQGLGSFSSSPLPQTEPNTILH